MPFLFITLRNSKYLARDDGNDYDTPEVALAFGARSAIDMASDEIERGNRNAAVMINVEQEDGTRLLSSVVSVSVSPLMATDPDSPHE